jgi:LacI family transcriptional regulator
MRPAITTIEQNGYDMGVKACTLLVNRIKNGNTMREVNHSVIRTSLVVRESTK